MTVAKQTESGQTVWLEITVKADHYLADLQSRIQQMAAGLPVEILRIRKDRVTRLSTEAAAAATLAELTPDDVFSRRLAHEQLPDELILEMKQRYQQIVAMVQQERGMTA
jgi:exonuclease SbcD